MSRHGGAIEAADRCDSSGNYPQQDASLHPARAIVFGLHLRPSHGKLRVAEQHSELVSQ